MVAQADSDNELPDTATSIFNWLLLGMLIILAGTIGLVINKRKKQSN